jgi:hypothetical protein
MAAVSDLAKRYVTGALAAILASANAAPLVDDKPMDLQIEEYVKARILLNICHCMKAENITLPIEIDNGMLGCISLRVVEDVFNVPMVLEGIVLLSLRNGGNREVLFRNNQHIMTFGVFATHIWTCIPEQTLCSRLACKCVWCVWCAI